MREIVTIAYLEDDQEQGATVAQWIEQQGMRCLLYEAPDKLILALESMQFDIAMLDVRIRGTEAGLGLLRHIRQERRDRIPVLMVSAEPFGPQVLSDGADDFLEKPLNGRTLTTHIRRLLRQVAHPSTVENYPPFQVNAIQQQISLNGKPLSLSDDEYALASELFRNFGKVMPYHELQKKLSQKTGGTSPRRLESDLQRLKNKMGLRGEEGWRLEPVYRHGIRLVNSEYDAR